MRGEGKDGRAVGSGSDHHVGRGGSDGRVYSDAGRSYRGCCMNDELVLKNRIRVARAERNISQGELAKMVGVSRQTISSIETGAFNPTAKLALILCIALEKKFEDLFYFD